MHKIFDKYKCVFIQEDKWEEYVKQFNLIQAAGGVVKNSNAELLLIFRLEKWDLPKGKIERGEPIRVAALREVQEECGISEIEIIRELPATYHTYVLKGESVLKKTHWFEMYYSGEDNNLIPQLEENITEARWMNKEKMFEAMQNTYPLIQTVLEPYLKNK